MKSSTRTPERGVPPTPPTILVADGGAPATMAKSRDPFAALDDLMFVVEALCPVWPPRPGFGPMGNLRL